MLWITKSAPLSKGAYVLGWSMSALSHETLCAHGGGDDDEVTVSHLGSPERLELGVSKRVVPCECGHRLDNHLIEVTSHPLATAYLQIRDPRKPLPPQTTSLFTADMDWWYFWLGP